MYNYISRHQSEWQELKDLVRKARGNIRKMSAEEIERLDVLYRRTTIHLSQVRTRIHDPGLETYLAGLVAAAHSMIYVSNEHSGPRQAGPGGVLMSFSNAVAGMARCMFLSAFLLLSGVGIAWHAVQSDPTAAYALMPANEIRMPGATPEQLTRVLHSGRDRTEGQKFTFASFLFSNNLRVGLLSLASGIMAGIPTVFLLVYNGMILGTFTATHTINGIWAEYFAWILPHGVTELWAIVLCGGAGLRLGRAVLMPGLVSRRVSLAKAAPDIVRVSIGIGVMLVFAAILESYLRQSYMVTSDRLATAALTAIAWSVYFGAGLAFKLVKKRNY